MLRQIKIAPRMFMGFAVILGATVAVIGGTFYVSESTSERLAMTVEAANAKDVLANRMSTITAAQRVAMRDVVLQGEIHAMQNAEEAARDAAKNLQATADQLRKKDLSDTEVAAMERTQGRLREIQEPLRRALGLATSFQPEDAAKIVLNEIDPISKKIQEDIDLLIEIQDKARADAIAASAASLRWTRNMSLVAIMVMLLASALLAWRLTRSVTTPLKDAIEAARRVASGDLLTPVPHDGHDEAAQLQRELEKMRTNLARIVLDIRQGAENIDGGAREVASVNQALTGRTEEHASSLQETASTIEEFTTAVRESAERAASARNMALESRRAAQEAGESVDRVVTTMQDVKESAARIGEIVNVIDGIAFQTNILALNAAVEAARAGEHGRGFGVVASEVRSLAKRCASSSKEIRELIEDSNTKVATGAKWATRSGENMKSLVDASNRVTSLMEEIATASQQQSAGIDQINKAITQMDSMVQQNASLVGEASSSASNMSEQAAQLNETVARFFVHEESTPKAVAPVESAPVAAAAPKVSGPKSAALARPAAMVAAGAAGTEDWQEF